MRPIFESSESSWKKEIRTTNGVIRTRFTLLESGSPSSFSTYPLSWPNGYWHAVLLHCPPNPSGEIIAWCYHLQERLHSDAVLACLFEEDSTFSSFPIWKALLKQLGYRYLKKLSTKGLLGAFKPQASKKYTGNEYHVKKINKRTCKRWFDAVGLTCIGSPQPKTLEVLPKSASIPFSQESLLIAGHPFVLLYDSSEELRQAVVDQLSRKTK